jgi:hypothetical protein
VWVGTRDKDKEREKKKNLMARSLAEKSEVLPPYTVLNYSIILTLKFNHSLI